MKWILVTVGILVGVVTLVVVAGALLPRKHHATRRAQFHQPREAVWQAITDYEKFPEWRPTVKRVEPLQASDGKPAWRETDGHGQVLPMEVTEWTPPARMAVRIADPNLPFGGTWTYVIEPVESGSALRITEDGEVYNPIFRFMARFVFGYTATMDDYLKALGARFGETVRVEP
jgi:uncharacterized protein YndB with AHSA1/START domain